MYKLMMVTNYYPTKTKYGDCYVMNGLLYKNINSNVIGRQNYTMWIYPKNPLYAYCKPEYIGKDVYIEFGINGYVNRCEVK